MIAEIEPAVEFKVWQAIQGGLDMVILRAKDADLESIRSTLSIMRTSLGNEFPIIVNAGNRWPKFAQASGYHLPEAAMTDEVVHSAMERAGWKIGTADGERRKVSVKTRGLGISVHSAEAAHAADALGPDYLLAGTIFPSLSHKDGKSGGLEHLRVICEATVTPVIAIGGITPSNASDCIKAGAAGVAALSPFRGAGREALAKAYKETMKS
jgi:thiamine monophosphate synthase